MRTRRIALTLAVVIPAAILVATSWLMNRPLWTPSLDDPSPAVRAAAIRALTPKGNERVLINALGDEDADVRLVAVMALADKAGLRGILRREEVARALVGVLGDEHASVRSQASYSLSWLGADAWPSLREALESSDPWKRSGALEALGEWHKGTFCWPAREADAIVPIVERLASDPDAEVRERANWILKRMEKERVVP